MAQKMATLGPRIGTSAAAAEAQFSLMERNRPTDLGDSLAV